MNSRMPCRITDGPQYDDDLIDLPELNEAEEQLVLSEIDPEWNEKFYDMRIAWNFFWEFRRPEMMTLALGLYRERSAVAGRLNDAIADIGATPAQLRRKALI